MKITIEKTVSFRNIEYDAAFNATVFYKKYGKNYIAKIFIDFFNQSVHIPKQPKHHKALVGLEKKLLEYYFN